MSPRAFIVGAPRSGSGKTTLTLGLLTALARRGVAVRAAKSGPDYIDPAFHAAATRSVGLNLDTWAMPPLMIGSLIGQAAAGAEVLVIESAMGLFDGVPGSEGRSGAAADLARRFGIPVMLVLDVSGQSQTAAAIVRGFASHDPGVRIAGVVLNRVGSPRHATLAGDAVTALGIPVLGAIPREDAVVLPERHLGLVQAAEQADLPAYLGRLGDLVGRHVDLDRALALAAPLALPADGTDDWLLLPGRRIALARDAAFTFVYDHMLEGWRRAGVEVAAFSPLADEAPPDHCDACWLPGGYPELHAAALSAAGTFKAGLARFAETRPVHGECGGYMVLGRALEDASGSTYPMAGLLSHVTSFARRRLHLGYREARLLRDGALGAAGSVLRGHEFHYASIVEQGDDAPFAEITDGQGRPLGTAGGRRGLVSGTFFHAIARA